MNEPKTPNLGLNKIDRSSPSTTYFDLDKYLDQNWEKVDDGVGQVEEKAEETAAQVSSIQERLDTEKRRSVTLEPGLQIINAERASAFKLEGLKGRTLVNLLGRDGGCEDLSKIGVHQSTLTLDSTNKVQGSNGLKIAISTGTSGIGFFTVSLKAGKSYIAIAEVKNFDGTSMFINLPGVGAVGNPVKDKSKFNVTWTRYTAPTDIKLNIDVGVSGTAVGQYGYADAVRLYEVSNTDYAALASMSPEQIGAKYPYVDSIQPVRNPYAIRYGENLLPPFYEWNQIGTDAKIASPYHLSVNTANAGGSYTIVKVPCLPNTTYRVKADVLTGPPVVIAVESLDETENTISTKYFMDGSFITEANARSVRISIYRVDAGALEVKNPTLTIGAESKPFKPREDATLALQTDLYADPLTGTNADEVFEKDGHYFKLAKWKRLALDSNYSYDFYNSYTGGKCVRLVRDIVDRNKNVLPIVTKYNGSYLSAGSPSVYVDQYSRGDWDTGANGAFLGIGVSSTDSGWGDSYTPTADEIKAYFMGWKMFLNNQPDVSKPYNGEAAGKAWCPLDSIYLSGGAASYYTNTLPVSPITVATYTKHLQWTPYQLVYQLARPTVEPIKSEGKLTLFEGENQVEVGTGVVLREIVKPVLANSYYRFNDTTLAGTILKNKLAKPLVVYRNGQRDNGWQFISDQYAYGVYKARKVPEQYDPSATYTVTYIIQDTSSVAVFVGSIADNEKALLTDNVNAIYDVTSRLDVLEDFFVNFTSEVGINNQTKISVNFDEDIIKGDMVRLTEVAKDDYTMKLSDNPQQLALAYLEINPDGKALTTFSQVSPFAIPYEIDPLTKKMQRISMITAVSNNAFAVAFWGDYMVVGKGYVSGEGIQIFKRMGNSYVRLNNPSVAPQNTVYSLAFSPDGSLLVVGFAASPYWMFYSRSGDTFTKLADPAGTPTSSSSNYKPVFSPDGQYLVIPNGNTTGPVVFKRNGNSVVKLGVTLSGSTSQGIPLFTPDSKLLIFSHLSNGGPVVFRNNFDDTFTSLTGAYKWTSSMGDASMSPDGKLLVYINNGTKTIKMLKISGETLTEIPHTIPETNSVYASRFSADGKFLFVVVDDVGIKIKTYELDKIVSARNINNVSELNATADIAGIGYALSSGSIGEQRDVMKLL